MLDNRNKLKLNKELINPEPIIEVKCQPEEEEKSSESKKKKIKKDKKNSLKGSSAKKVKIMKETSSGEDFPWLCVLSETKKKTHL